MNLFGGIALSEESTAAGTAEPEAMIMIGRSTLICLALIVVAVPTWAADRILEESYPAGTVDRLRITNGVGDVEVDSGDTDVISVQIFLTPRRGGVFSSMRRAEQEVEAARLKASEHNRKLRLELESPSDEPRFEARWMVTVPARVGFELELGVGDVRLSGLAGGVEMEVGVGNAMIEVSEGDVEVSVGVGNGTVRGPVDVFGSANASGGVGGATIDAEGDIKTGKGFVGHTSSWRGEGSYGIELEVGVGDAAVILE